MEFTYKAYEQLLGKLKKSNYTDANYLDYTQHEKPVILRHDIDVDLYKAVTMAEVEKSCGVKATYFIMLCTDFYNMASKTQSQLIKEIVSMGHHIGLHYDETKLFPDESLWNEEEIIYDIEREARLMEDITGVEIKSVSMHIPSKKTLESNLKLNTLINTYSQVFFKEFKYLSDSFHNWREDVNQIVMEGNFQRIHLLTHPIWYNEESYTREEAIVRYIEEGKEFRYQNFEDNILPRGMKLKDIL